MASRTTMYSLWAHTLHSRAVIAKHLASRNAVITAAAVCELPRAGVCTQSCALFCVQHACSCLSSAYWLCSAQSCSSSPCHCSSRLACALHMQCGMRHNAALALDLVQQSRKCWQRKRSALAPHVL